MYNEGRIVHKNMQGKTFNKNLLKLKHFAKKSCNLCVSTLR